MAILVFVKRILETTSPRTKRKIDVNKTKKWTGHIPKYAKDLSSDMPSLKTINVLRYKKKINRPGSKEIILPCLGAEFVRQTPKIIKFIIIIGTARAHSNWDLS